MIYKRNITSIFILTFLTTHLSYSLLLETEETKISSNLCNQFCISNSRLSVHEIMTGLLSACTIHVNHVCAHEANIHTLLANEIQADLIQSTTLNIATVCTENVQTTSLCSQQITTNNLCVQGNIIHSTAFKAFIALGIPTDYALGDIINFDTIIDDPHHDILANPTRYRAPQSGYYMATLSIQQEDLTGPTLFGLPVGRPTLLINDLEVIYTYNVFLPFTFNQRTTLTSMLHLNAGDEVSASYVVLIPDPESGVTEYLGTAILSGDVAALIYTTSLQIHYLSSDAASSCVTTCPTCPTVTIYGYPCIYGNQGN
ncbi:MAG: hypothetical protein WA432_04900 [Candidatus Babeliaceae bacterium]